MDYDVVHKDIQIKGINYFIISMIYWLMFSGVVKLALYIEWCFQGIILTKPVSLLKTSLYIFDLTTCPMLGSVEGPLDNQRANCPVFVKILT